MYRESETFNEVPSALAIRVDGIIRAMNVRIIGISILECRGSNILYLACKAYALCKECNRTVKLVKYIGMRKRYCLLAIFV